MSSLRFSRVRRKRLLEVITPYVYCDNDMMRQYEIVSNGIVFRPMGRVNTIDEPE